LNTLFRRQQQSTLASFAAGTSSDGTNTVSKSLEIHRLQHLRCVGVFAHIDAGKTTVTERMLALAGVVNRAGSVDSGNTVTDYLPAERERGITIQSAAISFPWKWHNSNILEKDIEQSQCQQDEVTINLIDTPGHVDFSVEVNRSVAVLDGAVLVVDSVAGVQAQTETVWRAISRPGMNRGEKHCAVIDADADAAVESRTQSDFRGHEPLACLALVNKMDKEGCNFGYALNTLRQRLPGANPVAIQIPLFKIETTSGQRQINREKVTDHLIAVPPSDLAMNAVKSGKFVGVVDLVDMRAVIWPDVATGNVGDVEECIPDVYNLVNVGDEYTNEWVGSDVMKVALASRQELVATLADLDETMEECFLMERSPSAHELRCALRRLTIARHILPVMAGAALRGKGVEPLLDAIADLLPSPLHRQPPVLLDQGNDSKQRDVEKSSNTVSKIRFGHPLHPSLLALAFKVIHMKNRGGSGDGRVVFVRIYSGKISTRDTIRVISPNMGGEQGVKSWVERVGGMLELAGGRFDNLKDAICYSGGVCALIGLKNVSTGDTIMSDSHDFKGKKGKKEQIQMGADYEVVSGNKCLAGVGAPKPVLTVRIEAENGEQQTKLVDALNLLMKEDPSLEVKETESVTLLSGLGELHIEVVVDRLMREFGLSVWTGKPTVAYRETIFDAFETPGMVNFDRTLGTTRMQAQVHLRLEPLEESQSVQECIILQEPVVVLSQQVKEYLGFHADADERELGQRCEIAQAILSGCKGALKRGPLSSNAMSNVKCIVQQIDSEGGISSLKALPGAIRAASSNILMSLLNENKSCCSLLEPNMSIEINVPTDMVGTVLSDLTTRRGTVGDVIMADENDAPAKALIYAQVPLAEILGYANNLRSITNGEGVFSAEYIGHSACNL
jgi:elongation factor G